MIITAEKLADRIRLTAIENMKGAFGNEGALPFYEAATLLFAPQRTSGKILTTFGLQFP
jgi:hypothetical protein